ncbi:4-hydroxy-tetrahydrodipicolinate reductase [Flammeovirgaceae bacterium SG7u.111]|nr:4-hydroxy-tetrahydrodipicolinate reductase [Flammeovirgaceae bacterium SG7u.132]WPO37696.1 4-hydroxy-tetrahydrodipicolinate reductase [Flammeovirgaceae bacterium SG7u.111]
MKILIVGYGKMGRTIEKIAKERGNEVPLIVDTNGQSFFDDIPEGAADVAIEFTQPEAAFDNIKACLERKIPVVSGTTGWLERKPEVEEIAKANGSAFFYASNYSIGVNLFFHLNKYLAKLMSGQQQYKVEMEEIHHTQKLDAPSGTAITLAEGIIENLESATSWVLDEGGEVKKGEVPIVALREPEVPGTHSIKFSSEVDEIEIKHTAHSRQGFAEGAVTAAEWLVGKKGVFGMEDMLRF